jgi:hypothetical protein
MLEPLIGLHPDGRELHLDCSHGSVLVLDDGPQWTEAQLVDFATSALAVRTRCECFGERRWVLPTAPEHISVDEVQVFDVDHADPDMESQRPAAIPPLAISLAADRLYQTHRADEHSLATDRRLVAWWALQRDLGLLRDDES